jgi:transcriptional regulator with XRE-family HTH domain
MQSGGVRVFSTGPLRGRFRTYVFGNNFIEVGNFRPHPPYIAIMVMEDANLETFGERIRRLRRKKGLSQKTLANSMGMREATLSRYENDKRVYQWDGLIKLADALDTSVDYLLGRTSISASIERFMSASEFSGGGPSFLEAYSKLKPDDQNLLMERALTLYDIRSRENGPNKD